MTYSTGGLIQAGDFNNIVGSPSLPDTGRTINAIWGTGFSNKGYGQSQLANVDENELISSENWSTLIKTINTVAYHQKSTITNYDPPVDGDPIEFLSSLVSNKNTLYTNTNYARQQGTTYTPPAVTTPEPWFNSATFTHTLTFESADKARYFFNAGGQIAITLQHTSGPNVNEMWHKLAQDAGTIVLSAPLPNTTSVIAGTTYDGVTRVGGSGDAVVTSNHGYYSLTQDYVEIFRKQAFAVFSNYLQSYVSIKVKSNGTQGVNGDRGSVITILTQWDEIPDGTLSTADTGVNVSVRYPYSTSVPTLNYPVPFTNTWGTVRVSGRVTAN